MSSEWLREVEIIGRPRSRPFGPICVGAGWHDLQYTLQLKVRSRMLGTAAMTADLLQCGGELHGSKRALSEPIGIGVLRGVLVCSRSYPVDYRSWSWRLFPPARLQYCLPGFIFLLAFVLQTS